MDSLVWKPHFGTFITKSWGDFELASELRVALIFTWLRTIQYLTGIEEF